METRKVLAVGRYPGNAGSSVTVMKRLPAGGGEPGYTVQNPVLMATQCLHGAPEKKRPLLFR